MLEHIILGLLLENEMNGYELKKTIIPGTRNEIRRADRAEHTS
ncbi:hypothetical protein [Paenibacillus sp. MER TA 81-3]|nr:hypothetical protein [Paenibacillus sp. MER TA 81-3]